VRSATGFIASVPHFTLQISSEGPTLNASVGVSQPRAAALKNAGQPIPKLMSVRALVDTGASCTCIDPSILTELNLTPTGVVSLNTPSTGTKPQQADQFDVSLFIPAPSGLPLFIHTMPVVASELLAAQGFHALLGRDVLSQCLFAYNGEFGVFTLAF